MIADLPYIRRKHMNVRGNTNFEVSVYLNPVLFTL